MHSPGRAARAALLFVAALSLTIAACADSPLLTKEGARAGFEQEPSKLASFAARGPNGVVAADHVIASKVGVHVLRSGGNAVDAAVTTSLVVCVVNPTSCGIGGGGFMVIYLADTDTALALDYRETAPAAASRDMYVRDGKAVPELSRRGGLAVGVPGELRGLAEALDKYGTITLAQALAPAIDLAENGYPVGKHLAESLAKRVDAIAAAPGLARVFLRDGKPLAEGETVTMPRLAKTMRAVAENGVEAFYTGAIAQGMVDAVANSGGILTMEDLANYRPTWRKPLDAEIWGHRFLTMPPPSSAGVVLQVLSMLKEDDLGTLGHGSVAFGQLLSEALQHAFADRARHYGDPLGMEVSMDSLLAPENITALRARFHEDRIGLSASYGSQPGQVAEQKDDAGTTHLSVMDKHGNAVVCTTTINTAFGAMLVAGDTGVIMNNEMDDFSAQPGVPNVYGLIGAEANSIAPGKRPLSSMSPTIAVRDGRAVAAAGGSGGPLIITGTLQSMLNHLVFGMPVDEAVAAPRYHHQWMPPMLAVEPGISAEVREGLEAKGHKLREFSKMAAIQMTAYANGTFTGASDPRKHGEAAAW